MVDEVVFFLNFLEVVEKLKSNSMVQSSLPWNPISLV